MLTWLSTTHGKIIKPHLGKTCVLSKKTAPWYGIRKEGPINMDDSELDFVDLCSKLLKRNRKKTVDQRQQKTSTQEPSSQSKKKNKKDDKAEAQSSSAVGGTQTPGHDLSAPSGTRAKDKVLFKMQQFKRDSPQRMVLIDQSQPTESENHRQYQQESQEAECSELVDSDEALAMRLQQELDRETRPVDLEDEGLFFCQLCNKDLSHMTPEGRTQHINRCLDEKEDPIAPPPPPAGVLECPICGKRFKSQKSRSSHLKRCSSDMGVPPAVLLQALQRQAEETQSTTPTNAQFGGQKRKGSKSNMPACKKSRRKVEDLDEDTMMAMALSSSLLEQEREKERETRAVREIIIETTAPSVSKSPALKWKLNAGKGRSKKKKVGMLRSPPLLLVQDAGAALARIQEHVSALLLHSRAPSPPTPTRSPSSLPSCRGTAPLWQKSALLSVSSVADFYAPELREYIVPWKGTSNIVPSFASGDNPEVTRHPVKLATPVTTSRSSILSATSQTGCSSPAVSTPGTGQFPGCSQALQDLMDLAEDGMTLTQYGYSTTEPTKEQQSGVRHSLNLPSSGFVAEEEDEQPNNVVSGFLPETLDVIHQKQFTTVPKGEEQRSRQHSLLLSKLALDLGSMVNNPQLSDVQLQVDSGEVYFAHSFMVYTRCPLLAEMIHESGFGVKEEGVPAAQRVLLNDVPGPAVFALLQYLYTAHCSFPSSLRPYVLELASRFDLKDLQEFSRLQEEPMLQTDAPDQHPDKQTDEAFIELLRSMWNDGDTADEGTDLNSFDNSNDMDDQMEDLRLGDRETLEEQVNEDELVEIYEFAATQRNKYESDILEEEKADNQDMPEVFPSPTKKDDPKEGREQDLSSSLDRSYNRLFSQSWGEFEEKDHSTLQGKKVQSQLHLPSEMSARMLLQSSASVIDKMSPSPPPDAQNLPVAGISPGFSSNKVGHSGGREGTDEILKSKNESRDAQDMCKVIPPHASPKNKEPELVVLSDSSDDMNIDLTQSSNSPSPKVTKGFTGIRERHTTRSHDQNAQEIDARLSDDEASLGDGSLEVSWLIPSTPVQPGKSVRTSSSQTKSSICRTQLFPQHDNTPPQSPHSTAKYSAPKTSSRDPPISSSETSDRQSSLDLTRDKKLDSAGFAVPRSPSKFSHLANQSRSHLNTSKQDTPLPTPAYSSTPVQTDISKLRPNSPCSAEKLSGRKTQNKMESPEKAEVQSFHLYPLSECSSSHSKANSRSYNKSRLSEDCKSGKVENEVASLRNEDNFEAEGGESSFRQSFVDEPPIAFNDSWGLDACAENPCFSLKLEDSRGSLQPEDSPNFKADTAIAHPCSPPDQRSDARTSMFESPNKKSATAAPPDESEQDYNNILMESKIWDSWEEEDEEKDVALPLSQRLKPTVQHKTPISKFKKRHALVPITPMPHYSDMDTPELKNKLNKFGVRPLPKRQMILKLKEIHHYTHQLVSSDSDDEAPSAGHTSQAKPSMSCSTAFRPASCSQTKFKQPTASPSKLSRDDEPLSASQGSTTSSTAESERSNPELVPVSDGDSDSDGGFSASQSASRLQERLQAVRALILSDSTLYNQILQYKPLVLSRFQQQLKAAGIRLGVNKLADYLDSQCITFTTAKPGQTAPSRRRVRKTKAVGESGVRRKKAAAATH